MRKFTPQSPLRPLAQALSLAFLTLPAAGHAAQVSSTYSFDHTLSSSATAGSGTSSSSPTTGTYSTSFIQFDATQGVLTGTSIGVSSARTRTISGSGTSSDGATNGSNNKATATAFGKTDSATFSAPGLSNSFGSQATGNKSCNVTTPGQSCGISPTTGSNTANALIGPLNDPAQLNAYVGSGTMAATHTLATTITASNAHFASTSAKYSANWKGDFTVVYDYLRHAAPSFAAGSDLLTLDLDFGSVAVGSDATLSFDLFARNAAGNAADRIGLDLDSVSTGGGDVSQLSFIDLLPFTGMAAGLGRTFEARLDTSAPGAFTARYVLSLSDADLGAPSSRFDYRMTINLSGSVFQQGRGSDVPEPGTALLVSLGVLGLGGWRARRRRAEA